jgi:hypothetical protein
VRQAAVASAHLGATQATRKQTSTVQMPSFGALIVNKVVVPSANSTYLAVDQHLFYQLAMAAISAIEFDEAWYLSTYTDIRDAIAAGVVSSAQHHYIRHGYYEHRLPRKVVVDEAWYLDVHKDVQEALTRRHYSSGQEHFQLSGYREGRLPYPGFVL